MKTMKTEKIAVFHTSKATYRSSAKRELKGFFEAFDPEYFGVNIYPNEEDGNVYDDSQNIVCTIEELESNNGTMNLDNEYDMYDWKPISELTEEEISGFVYGRFGGITVAFNKLFFILEQPDAVKILVDLKADADDIAHAIYHELTVQDLIDRDMIELNDENEYELK